MKLTCLLRFYSCFLENDIDGSTLIELTIDVAEFATVLPKSGHRLLIKKLIRQQAVAADGVGLESCQSERPTPSGEDIPVNALDINQVLCYFYYLYFIFV